MSAEAAHDELIALVSKTSEGPLLSETARAWCADVGVLRRYIDCAEANGCAAADNAQFLAKTARWRDAWRVDAMMDDEPLLEYERELRKLLLYDLATDHVGRPLLIERIGAWDLAALTEAVEAESERIVRAHVLVSERIRRQVDGRVREAPTAAQRQAVVRLRPHATGRVLTRVKTCSRGPDRTHTRKRASGRSHAAARHTRLRLLAPKRGARAAPGRVLRMGHLLRVATRAPSSRQTARSASLTWRASAGRTCARRRC
eukprot:940375-Prymnesium_polylepis.2